MYKLIFKNLLDFILSFVGIVLLFPAFIFISSLIFLKLGYPILYKQERPGKKGKSFMMYKFRSMTNEKDEKGVLLPNDKRLTLFGKKLRSTSLDELPSLLNVIKGEMSIVGPRPLRVRYLPLFTPKQNKRHNVKPGITGYAQVNGRSNITWVEKFKLDSYYVDNLSFWLDIKIIFKTLWNVISKKDINPEGTNFEIPFDEYIKRKIMREDQRLSSRYEKNERFEEVINSLNQQLEKSQQNLLENLEELYPTIHILGAPRSATTLVSQLIPSYLEVAHINNLIAAFWKAPIYGIELSKKLIKEPYLSSFSSDFGRTQNINEPHEFGYFWNYHLKYSSLHQKSQEHEDLVDWNHIVLLLNNMTAAIEKPIIFKSFLLGFHAKTLYNNLPKSKFIYIKRNLIDNVMSILKLRKKLNGDINIWGSIKPKQYDILKDLNVYEQVVGQILCLEHEYLSQLELVPKSNKLFYTYEDLCENPNLFLKQVKSQFLNENLESENINPFQVSNTNIKSSEKHEILKALDAIKKLFPNLKSLVNV